MNSPRASNPLSIQGTKRAICACLDGSVVVYHMVKMQIEHCTAAGDASFTSLNWISFAALSISFKYLAQ